MSDANANADRVKVIAYNVPVDLEPEYAVLIATHSGSPTMITITNRSVTNAARVFVNAGAWTANPTLAANSLVPFDEVRDFGGATVMISNISTTDATLRVLVAGLSEAVRGS